MKRAIIAGAAMVTIGHAWAADVRTLVERSSYRDEKDVLVFPAHRKVDYPPEGVNLGQGWDSLRDAPVPAQCVVFTPREAGGQTARVELRRILDADSLRHELAISYSASAKADFGVGGGGGSVKTNFVSSSEVSREFLNLLVKGEVQNGMEFASAEATPHGLIELSAFAQGVLQEARKAADDGPFVSLCGDSFVAAIQRGANLYALYQFSSDKKTDRTQKTTSIDANGSYLAFSGSASTSSTELLETVRDNKVSGLKYLHVAHRGLRLAYNEQTVYDSLASLGTALELKDASPYAVSLVRYDQLPGWKGDRLETGPATREALLAFYYRLKDLLSVASAIQKEPERYALGEGHDLATAAVMPSLLASRLAEVSKVLTECEKMRERIGADQATKRDAARKAILKSCVTSSEDGLFSDYPFRALMPIERIRVNPIHTKEKNDELKKRIDALESQYAHAIVSIVGPCANLPSQVGCPALARQIAQLKQELALFLAATQYADVAESRYLYWVKAAADIREEQGLVNGALQPSELAMWRREIFCQYGKSPDVVPCPTASLAEMAARGYVGRTISTAQISVSGKAMASKAEAWSSLEDAILEDIAKLAKGASHYFTLANERYSLTEGAGTYQFSVTGDVSLTSFQSADATRALALP